MKKILLLGSLLLPLFSYEIRLNKNFSTEVLPTKLSVSVSITTRDKTSKDVLDKLSKYSDFIKSFKELDIKGGQFNTSLEYQYVDRKRVKNGYLGSVYFQVGSKDEDKLKNFISMITAQNIDNDVDLNINSSNWRVDKKDIQKAEDSLRLKALMWADKYAKSLSEKIGKSCEVKAVDFSGKGFAPPPVMYDRAIESISAKSVPTPKKSAQTISINPLFKFDCK